MKAAPVSLPPVRVTAWDSVSGHYSATVPVPAWHRARAAAAFRRHAAATGETELEVRVGSLRLYAFQAPRW